MTETRRNPLAGALAVAAGLMALVLAWVYWPTFASLVHRWSDDPQSSHGFLVPLIAILLLYFAWDRRPKTGLEPNWYGVAVLAGAAALRFLAAYVFNDWLDAVSFIVALAGAVLVIAGVRWLYWARWALAFLIFMVPLPFLLEQAVSGPLQRGATVASTYVLQTLGYPAVAEGNMILVGALRMNVLEACNGLGMLQSFIMLSAAMALLTRRPLVERLILFASGLPIALLANLIRITGTALLTLQTTDTATQAWIHTVAGWLMIPLALLLLWLVTKLMDHFWLDPTAADTGRQSRPVLTPN
jgi:exosortase